MYVELTIRDDAGRVFDPASLGVDAIVDLMRARPVPSAQHPGQAHFEQAILEPAQSASVCVLQSVGRIAAQVAALQAAAVCAVADDSPDLIGLDPTCDELAAALVLSRRSARFHRDTAETVRAHPGVWAALAAGDIDATRARILARALFEIPSPEEAGPALPADGTDYRFVLDQGLRYAREHTSAQLDQYLRRLLAGLGLGATSRSRRRAMAERGVWISHRGDGTADLAAVLASEDAERLYATVRSVALADRQRTPTDDESTKEPMPAWLAEALVDLVLGPGRTTRDCDAARAGESGALVVRANDQRMHPPWPLAGPPARVDVQTQIVVTIPIDSLAGLSDQPGTINGFGVVPADVARRLAAGDARWRHIFVHRGTGVVLDVGTLSYRPPAALARHVRLRDGTCRFPGCRVPAHECDLDHLVAFPGGPTSAENLHASCRHHHRLKHEGGWRVQGATDGRLRWTSPLGIHRETYPAETYPAEQNPAEAYPAEETSAEQNPAEENLARTNGSRAAA